MNDEVIKKLLEYIDGSKDFLLEHAPQIFKEMLHFEYLMALVQTFVFSFLVGVALYIGYHCYKSKVRETYGSRPTEQIMGMIIPFTVTTFLLIGIWDGVSTAIKIKISPKYYLLENIKKLTK